MTTFELCYISFVRITQRYQISTIFNSTIEHFFETLETVYVDMSTAHSVIRPIVNQNFVNIFQHQNGPTQRQQIH